MTDNMDTSPEEDGESPITVRRLVPAGGVTSRQIIQAVRHALAGYPHATISVAVVDDATIASLHRRYLDDPAPTDVLTFDLRDDPENDVIEGEIVVSAETARRQSARHRTSPQEELLRCVVHGALHLLGYNDGTAGERRKMKQTEDRVLASLRRRRTGRRPSASERSGGV